MINTIDEELQRMRQDSSANDQLEYSTMQVLVHYSTPKLDIVSQ